MKQINPFLVCLALRDQLVKALLGRDEVGAGVLGRGRDLHPVVLTLLHRDSVLRSLKHIIMSIHYSITTDKRSDVSTFNSEAEMEETLMSVS